MKDAFFELPAAAQRLVREIEATISEADSLLGAPEVPPDIVFSLQETRARYLPDTLNAYVAVPASQRSTKDEAGRSAKDQLLEQLSVLDRATRRHLEILAAQKRSELAVNARFLAKRFDDRSAEISAISQHAPVPSPSFLRNWLPGDTSDAKSTVAFVGGKFREAFPQLTEFGYGGMWGMGPIESASHSRTFVSVKSDTT